MKTIDLTGVDTPASHIGLGCMGMSEFYGPSDDAESMKVLERALEIGVNFLDTADMYGAGRNEELIARILPGRRDRIVLATKCGIVRGEDPRDRRIDTSPAYIKTACEASLKRLCVETIDLYYLHRLDGETPIEDSMGALKDLAEAGKIRAAGLSEVSAETLRKAHETFPVSAVQSEYSLTSREPESNGVLQACADLGTRFVAYSPLGRGLLAGAFRSEEDLAEDDSRRSGYFPRFVGENLKTNLGLADQVAAIAKTRGATPAQIALAWLLTKPGVVPIPGTRKIDRLEENAAAGGIYLSDDDIANLETALPPGAAQGGRYHESMMGTVDR
ncbi:aldo/keto reductase [Maricaulaceae bacterium MS644]